MHLVAVYPILLIEYTLLLISKEFGETAMDLKHKTIPGLAFLARKGGR